MGVNATVSGGKLEAGVGVGVELEFIHGVPRSQRWFEAVVCPDGNGGIIITQQDTHETSGSHTRGVEYNGIIRGNQYARGHAK